MIDRDILRSQALLVDGNPTSRSILASQLREFGVAQVVQCGRVQDARRYLESQEFDIILCEQFFEDGSSGQDLLDDLRKSQLLPYSTVFVMVTAEATYTRVSEAAESALDSYLLKPHTAAALAERLRQARYRKKVLRSIFQAIERDEFDQAARLCMQRFAARDEFWLFAARLGTELLLRMKMVEAALKLSRAVLAERPIPWARLDVARAEAEQGQLVRAQRTLEELLTEQPGYADACDLLARIQLELGQQAAALETYRRAAALTPGSISRLQKAGMLAFYAGERDAACKQLERAALIGMRSKSFDLQALVLLAFLRYGQRDGRALQRCVDDLESAARRDPENTRLKRLAAAARVLPQLASRQHQAVADSLRAHASSVLDPDFDAEAATHLLLLLAQAGAAGAAPPEMHTWVEAIALRFCTSHAVTEWFAGACAAHPALAEVIRSSQGQIAEWSAQALEYSLKGNPQAAAKALLAHAERTRNMKLIDTARRVLTVHEARIPDAATLLETVDAIRRRFEASAQAFPLGRSGSRDAGALSLRKDVPATA